ncbi:MAG: 16S rRNA (guanine(966)-N(2))-methyltransferase RsmD [Anaerolineaceae bacterium]|nr:16S rRNA (guanine(966)-N(2))-methyltransferase RsmD [Anaerolineaceae bacterium]
MSRIRVISGKARGVRLKQADASITRPITDRVKEALFNIIGSDIINSRILDMFAGTGSVGIEALSRGASYAMFLDVNSRAIDVINSNLSVTKLSDKGNVQQVDAFEYLGRSKKDKFEYIYIAPPQYNGMWITALERVDNNLEWMSNDGWVIAQMDPSEFTEYDFKNLFLFDKRQYGNTVLAFYNMLGDENCRS